MSSRKKHRAPRPVSSEDDAPKLKAAPERINSPFAGLQGLKAPPKSEKLAEQKRAAQQSVRQRSAPLPGAKGEPGRDARAYSYGDRAALQQAFAGVRPLDAPAPDKGKSRKRANTPKTRAVAAATKRDAAESAARARLDELVGGGVRFVVESDGDGGVRGRRTDLKPSAMTRLWANFGAPERRLDLHGLDQDDAGRETVRFVRDAHRRGARHLLIIHGKGLHSDGGTGVLRAAAVRALTRGGAAPVVFAFQTATEALGGLGALMVYLKK